MLLSTVGHIRSVAVPCTHSLVQHHPAPVPLPVITSLCRLLIDSLLLSARRQIRCHLQMLLIDSLLADLQLKIDSVFMCTPKLTMG